MKKFLKWFFGSIISLIVIVVIVGVVFINLTPRQLKLQNLNLGGYTIEELGIADTKFIDIYKSFKSIGKTNEEDVVENGYDEEEESQNANDAFVNSSLDGSDDYSVLVNAQLTYDKQYLLSYDDTTLGYIFNNIVQNTSSSEGAIKYLHDANVQVVELSITISDNVGYVRIVAYIDISEFKGEVENALGPAKSFLTVPDKVYIVSEQSFVVNDTTGKMETTPISMTVNGKKDDPVGNAVLKIAFEKAGGDTNEEELNSNLGKALASVVYNIGKIGSATSVNEQNEITGEVSLGMSGVNNHKIDVVTHQHIE